MFAGQREEDSSVAGKKTKGASGEGWCTRSGCVGCGGAALLR